MPSLYVDSGESWSEELFDRLPDVVFFVKNSDGEYVKVNNTLVSRCGVREKTDLLGKKPSQTHGARLGVGYERQDEAILRHGAPLTDQLELHAYPSGVVGWCLTTKRAIRNRRGKIVGIAGISRDLRPASNSEDAYAQLKPVIDYAKDNLTCRPSLRELADVANLSVYQLDRRFRQCFDLTTGQWLLQQRIERAQHGLTKTDLSIVEIALDCGYQGQSTFTRQFRRSTGFTPRSYRKIHKVY